MIPHWRPAVVRAGAHDSDTLRRKLDALVDLCQRRTWRWWWTSASWLPTRWSSPSVAKMAARWSTLVPYVEGPATLGLSNGRVVRGGSAPL